MLYALQMQIHSLLDRLLHHLPMAAGFAQVNVEGRLERVMHFGSSYRRIVLA